MQLVEIRNTPQQKFEDELATWIKRLTDDPLPVHFYENLDYYEKKLAWGKAMRFKIPSFVLSEKFIEKLRVGKHMHSALETLKHMGNDPQPEGTDLYKSRMADLEEDMLLGKFTEEDLKKELQQRRQNDPFNPHRGLDIQTKLMKALIGTPECAAAVEKTVRMKAKAIQCVEKIRDLDARGKLTVDNHRTWMKMFRVAMLGGFTKEQLEDGSFFSLSDVGTSRPELDALDPNKKTA